MEMDLFETLRIMVRKNASDLYLKAGTPPVLRIEGELCQLRYNPLKEKALEEVSKIIMNERQQKAFAENPEMNLIYSNDNIGRFRVNIYQQRNSIGMVFRRVRTDIPTIEKLNLPPILKELILEKRGLILVTGATGVGKSTTLAAMIDHRNTYRTGHIITLEDPLEFVHFDKRSIISQREIGIDSVSYGEALKSAVRQAPDVILIGEMRDTETVSSAIYFAETGHLVLSTLHSVNTNQAFERMMQFFPSENHMQIYMQLSLNLKAIVSQRLIPRSDGKSRAVAVEVMIVNPHIRDLIRKGEILKIKAAMETIGAKEGMQTFDQSILELYNKGLVTREDALTYSDSPNDLSLKMRGVGVDKSYDAFLEI